MPLEDASWRRVRWDNGGYVPFAPPTVGQSIALPAALNVTDQFR